MKMKVTLSMDVKSNLKQKAVKTNQLSPSKQVSPKAKYINETEIDIKDHLQKMLMNRVNTK